jgi:ribosomal subunit interface protein
MDTGAALTKHIEEHLNRHVKKYFENAVNADVHCTKQGASFKVVLIINEGVKGGIKIKSDASAGDIYGCFNEAMEKAAKQLSRYKGRIKNYRREMKGLKSVDISEKIFDAPKYVISAIPYPALEEMEAEESKESSEKLNIVAEKTTEIEELTVNQAIMKMDLAGLPALVFINQNNKRINVVYVRKDGNVSWIDPKIYLSD